SGRNNNITNRNKSPSKRNRSKSPKNRNSCPPQIPPTHQQQDRHSHTSHTNKNYNTTGYQTDASIHTLPESDDEMNYPGDTDDVNRRHDQNANKTNFGFNSYLN